MSQVVNFTPREKARHVLRCPNCGCMSWKIAKSDANDPLRAECSNCEEYAGGIEIVDTN